MIDKIYALSNRSIGICDFEYYNRFSVLIPIIVKGDELYVLFEIRSEKLEKQPNEICFPGGRIEKAENKIQAAIRESCEELMIFSEDIKIIAELDTVVTPFNTIIYPYAGFLYDYQYTYNSDEVKDVFEVPLRFFLDNAPLCYNANVIVKPECDMPFHLIPKGKNYPWAKGKYPVYFYKYEGKVIWGITARIVYNFISLIS